MRSSPVHCWLMIAVRVECQAASSSRQTIYGDRLHLFNCSCEIFYSIFYSVLYLHSYVVIQQWCLSISLYPQVLSTWFEPRNFLFAKTLPLPPSIHPSNKAYRIQIETHKMNNNIEFHLNYNSISPRVSIFTQNITSSWTDDVVDRYINFWRSFLNWSLESLAWQYALSTTDSVQSP